jgi:hypothetical protein
VCRKRKLSAFVCVLCRFVVVTLPCSWLCVRMAQLSAAAAAACRFLVATLPDTLRRQMRGQGSKRVTQWQHSHQDSGLTHNKVSPAKWSGPCALCSH